MKKFITIFLTGILILSVNAFAQTYPTIYASKASGTWATVGIWETFPGNATNTPGTLNTGTAAVSAPSGTHFVYIRNTHTVTMGASKNCMGVTVESGGTLLGGGAFTLKLATGGTGFLGPNNFGINNSGIIGQASDVITVEVPVAAGTVTLTGTGTYLLGRLRMVGGNPNSPVVNLDANISFNQSANYALTAIYNPLDGDNFTLNLNAGKTVTLTSTSGYFSNSSIANSTYTYNINGTLDLSANNQTAANLTAISPVNGTVNLNVGATGLIKTGAAFNSSPVSPGVANLNIASGGVVDATLATVFNFANSGFNTASPTAILKRSIPGDGTQVNLPLKTPGGNATPAIISRNAVSGTSAIYTASIQNTFDNTPSDITKCVQKQWNLSITGTPSVPDTVRLSWLASDNGSNFNPALGATIMHYTAGAYEYRQAIISGTGVVGDPYIAKAWGFNGYSPFGVTNIGVLPVTLSSFTGYYNGSFTKLLWSDQAETGLNNFEVEKSSDGIHFSSLATVAPNAISASGYSYIDNSKIEGILYYRLKINETGRFTYSNIISIKSGVKGTGLSLYPNPVVSTLIAEHAPAVSGTVINIFSADGKLVMSQKAVAGSLKTAINVNMLQKGNYTFIMNDAAGKSSVNFIKQ